MKTAEKATKTKEKTRPRTTEEIIASRSLTPKQAKLIELIAENDSRPLKSLIKEAGYSDSMAKVPSRVIPFRQLFEKKISPKMVLKAHSKLLMAKTRVRTYVKGELKTEYEQEDTLGIAKGVDLAYRVMGAFAPVETKHTITGLEAKSDDELEQMLMEEQKTLNRSSSFKKNVIEGEVIEDK